MKAPRTPDTRHGEFSFACTRNGWLPVPLIDQRILIDAPPEAVWQVIADQNRLAQWHAGCRSVSVLTTQQRGPGVRRRCTLVNGKDVIEEITTWVEGMGYEYRRVEGGPYKAYQGRLRLQLGPDGTSVQWTINYTPKGLIGSLRDRFGGQRALAQIVSASLRQLRREVDALGQRMNDEARARAAIRERLNADERAAVYQQRHAQTAQGAPDAEAIAGEPAEQATFRPQAEPSFVSQLAAVEEPPVDPSADTQPQDAPEGEAPAPPAAEPMSPSDETTGEEDVPLHQRVTPARGTPSVQPSSGVVERPAPPESEPPVPLPTEIKPPVPPPDLSAIQPPVEAQPDVDPYRRFRRPADATKPLSDTPPKGIRPAELARQDSAASTGARRGLPPQTPEHDTGEISIWDVFGIRRPSEQDADALDDLIQSIQARQMAEQRLQGRFFRRSARVRYREGVPGLRLKLALQGARVRLEHRLGTRIRNAK